MYAGTALGYMAEATAGQGESSLTGVRETKEIQEGTTPFCCSERIQAPKGNGQPRIAPARPSIGVESVD